ncbi:DUF5050 domain-containing protein [uncultured Pseudoramibacter sp.]|uniref:DUF5050 domain-containing protein n=1 Tax=uncultured Pseudoramibacter sp. TaxID=1623493 RepID=UPI0025EDB118|nr:DUF5050 domain-containing protein [uncultured Pseudoramibacter sp.]
MINDYEETEELEPISDPNSYKPAGQQKNNNKIILLVVILIAAAAVVLGYFDIRHIQYRKKIEQAAAYQDAGKTDQAKQAYKEAAALQKRNAYPYTQLGEIYLDQGAYNQAIKYLKLANDREGSSETYTALGDAYTGKGDAQKAAAAYKKADKQTDTETNQYQKEKAGNTNGNLEFSYTDICVTGGHTVKSGKWLYYTSDDAIYRSNGKKTEKLQNNYGQFLNFYNGCLYYECDLEDGGCGIYKLNPENKKEETVYENSDASKSIEWMKVYRGRIYYVVANADLIDNLQPGSIHSMKLDGSGKKTVVDSDVYYNSVSIDNGHIYYIKHSQREYVRTDLNGSNSEDVVSFSDGLYANNRGAREPRVVYTDQDHVIYWLDKKIHVLNLKTDKTFDIEQPDDVFGYEQLNHDSDGKYYYLLTDDEQVTGRGKGNHLDRYSVWRLDSDGTNYKKLYSFESTMIPCQSAYGDKICVNYYTGARQKVDVIDAETGKATTYIDLPRDN